ncbi:MAG: FAD-dependent oxidoreductase [Candidatus Thermofonsia Clade 1 bacterium]|uniref:FAD-dependent oxidoreductase n=1 Tax=Candidatus Thermofonsia Clade 1 bacterium TaxID=2364210 RepID=A0A2M8PHL7_9CHLR|nr:MAG: FAD-dependent oxidoreductase [Candidatus Thermofonsia Clade 1 bacterium]
MAADKRVVVIGGGVGGLTAGALLAREGFEVTVLEAHVYPGGCAGTFYHKGYHFDAGATVAGGFQKGGPHQIAGALLGITWQVERIEPAWVIHLPDCVITRWGEEMRWREERAAKLPALRHFWRIQEQAAEAAWQFAARLPEYPPASLADLLRLATKIRPNLIPISPLALMSMGQLLNLLNVRDPNARAFIDAQLLISAQTTSRKANALYGAIAVDLPRVGVYHPRGGIGNIARQLAEALAAHGGRIIYRHAVTQIERRADKTFRLHTNKGNTFEADIVLANLTPWALADLLGEAAPPALQREVKTRPSTWGAFTLYLGLPSAAVPSHAEHFQIVQDLSQPLGEGNSVFISISSPHDLSRAPSGMRAVTLSTHTAIAPWWHLRQNDPEGYQERIAQYRDRLLDAAERVIPNVRSAAQLILPGTPAAFQRFTRRPLGMVGGFPFASLLNVRGPHTGIENLWLVGDSIFPGQSTAGVTAGALRVAAEVVRNAARRRLVQVAQISAPSAS